MSNQQTETPMSDHIARFWHLLKTEHVRILVDIRRDHDDGIPHWDSASFPNDVAKALAATQEQRGEPGQEQREELARYFEALIPDDGGDVGAQLSWKERDLILSSLRSAPPARFNGEQALAEWEGKHGGGK